MPLIVHPDKRPIKNLGVALKSDIYERYGHKDQLLLANLVAEIPQVLQQPLPEAILPSSIPSAQLRLNHLKNLSSNKHTNNIILFEFIDRLFVESGRWRGLDSHFGQLG